MKRDLGAITKILAQPPNDQMGTPESQNGEGSTPIHEAAKKGLVDFLEKMLEKKPDVTIRDSKGSTALQVRDGVGEEQRGRGRGGRRVGEG
jgi:ankyrin repeat protein